MRIYGGDLKSFFKLANQILSMGLFGDDKKKKLADAQKKAAEERRSELQKIISSRPSFGLPKAGKATVRPKEYTEFLKDVRQKPVGFYEKATAFSGKLLNVRPSVDDYKKIDEDIKSAYMVATPTGVFSLTIIVLLFVMFLTLMSVILNLGSAFIIFVLIFGLSATYYTYSYPNYKGRVILARMSADTVLAILYMIIYMRSSPNLEGAIRFSSENLQGPLSLDLKKLMWDIEVGSYPTADVAIAQYVERWKNKNPEFAESLNLLRETAVDPVRREKLFSETIGVILDGTRERTKHYVAGLRMPIMLIHAMGILLPVMGLVLFPIVLIFMSNTISPVFLFLGYDLILPLFLWFATDYLLRQKPPTFSQPDISLAKGVPPLGKYSLNGKEIPIWPIALLVLLIFGGVGTYMYTQPPEPGVCTDGAYKANSSLIIIIGLGLSIFVYAFLDSVQKMRIRSDIEKIESEFSVALFQLGNQISRGTPIEVATERAAINLKGMKISDLFANSAQNMRKFGLTFEQSLFDKNSGAIWYYPSRLIQSIMKAIIESTKKGMAAASDAMVSISQYLKGVHDVKEDVAEILGEITTSMRFLGTFLAPMVAGVTITMAVVIIQILTIMGSQIAALAQSSDGEQSFTGLQGGFLSAAFLPGNKLPIGPAEFQLIVGIYMLETVLIISVFVNKIEYGEDAIGLRSTIAWSAMIAVFIYALSWAVTYSMFGGPIREIMTPTQLAGNLAQCT